MKRFDDSFPVWPSKRRREAYFCSSLKGLMERSSSSFDPEDGWVDDDVVEDDVPVEAGDAAGFDSVEAAGVSSGEG